MPQLVGARRKGGRSKPNVGRSLVHFPQPEAWRVAVEELEEASALIPPASEAS